MDDAAFWELITLLDWTHTGVDDRVVRPVVDALAKRSLEEIHQFQELLARKLYALDGRKWARESGSQIWWGEPASLSADSFLYARCVVVANGRPFYDSVLADPAKMPKNMEFEALLDMARKAEERQLGASPGVDTEVSYETFSNRSGWA
ncbi:MAG: DUF4240 domain-containing protein [Candidatus Dormibacteraeota bacterium]|nr:DUF4240 domain-containing protein [Candidatus Dormibacteraeota bacterium]